MHINGLNYQHFLIGQPFQLLKVQAVNLWLFRVTHLNCLKYQQVIAQITSGSKVVTHLNCFKSKQLLNGNAYKWIKLPAVFNWSTISIT